MTKTFRVHIHETVKQIEAKDKAKRDLEAAYADYDKYLRDAHWNVPAEKK